MHRPCLLGGMVAVAILMACATGLAQPIHAAGRPAQLDIRAAGQHSIRVTLKPIDFEGEVTVRGILPSG